MLSAAWMPAVFLASVAAVLRTANETGQDSARGAWQQEFPIVQLGQRQRMQQQGRRHQRAYDGNPGAEGRRRPRGAEVLGAASPGRRHSLMLASFPCVQGMQPVCLDCMPMHSPVLLSRQGDARDGGASGIGGAGLRCAGKGRHPYLPVRAQLGRGPGGHGQDQVRHRPSQTRMLACRSPAAACCALPR